MRAAVILMVGISGVMQTAGFAEMLAPSHTVNISHSPSRGLSPDRWSHGFLPMFHSMRVPGDPVEVWMYGRDGREVIRKTRILPPEVYQIVPFQVAALPDATLVLSAEMWTSAAEVVSVLCFVKPPGVLEKIVRTDSLVADSLAVERTGAIWGFGSPPVARFQRRATYNTLAKWDRDGRQLGTFIPRSVFATDENPAMYGNAGVSRVLVSPTKLVLYSTEAKEWLELDRASAEIVDRFHLEAPNTGADGGPARAAEIVMTESNRVYAHFSTGSRSENVFFQLDRKQRRWVPLPKDSFPADFRGLMGAEGNSLILRSGPGLYGWFPAPDIVTEDS
jgi:hypothetical protein